MDPLTEASYGEFYDQALHERDDIDDIECYLALCRRYAASSALPVIEAGCGTGRVTIPIARAGFSIVAFDLSRAGL